MKYFILLFALFSCTSIKNGIHQHYHLYSRTKVLYVISKDKYRLTAISPAGQQKYIIKDTYNQFHPGDTIWLDKDYWVFGELTFKNR